MLLVDALRGHYRTFLVSPAIEMQVRTGTGEPCETDEKRSPQSEPARAEFCWNQAMALIDEIRMDRSVISVVTTETPSDAREYWKTRTMEERLEALEITRQILNGYDPDTTRFQRVLEVARCP